MLGFVVPDNPSCSLCSVVLYFLFAVKELEANPVLTDFAVQDLNVNTKLPYEDNTFDFITNTVSVDYLIKPLEVQLLYHIGISQVSPDWSVVLQIIDS